MESPLVLISANVLLAVIDIDRVPLGPPHLPEELVY